MKRRQADAKDRKTICLAGNPNVGKSTVFNALTGARQHTGNWAGKTVSNAKGSYMYGDTEYTLVDLPGTYSLLAQSAEEVVARDFICFGGADVVVVVCDATCLERNCNLALQILEITGRVVVCVNLMDEAEKKKIAVNISELEKQLGVPVVATAARGKKGLEDLRRTIDAAAHQPPEQQPSPRHMRYIAPLEEAVALLEPAVRAQAGAGWNSRWAALRLLDDDPSIVESLGRAWGKDILQEAGVAQKREEARRLLAERGIPQEQIKDKMVSCFVITAEGICADCVQIPCCGCHSRDRKIDRILTSKATGIPIMLLLLMAVFWITITGANYPSQILSDGLFWVQDRLTDWFAWMDAPQWLHGALVLGVYRVLAWVVSVMLPPMAIFFPLFTLLEDFGYLPRIAFNLDKYFQKAHACGKQALTMCMGFGCNAVGITGCRIIDSPRERLIAMLTNSFVPCNGRFPTILAMISMFFVGTAVFPLDSLLSTAVLTGVILLGIGMTFLVSWILSKTILKGVPSSFTLELPPYRRPQFGKVIVRSVLDRTIFVLGRAAVVAAPAGLLIWILANVTVGGDSLLSHCAGFLDPFARWFGMDGVILLAFILGFPANEIVIPILIMAYLSTGTLTDFSSLAQLQALLVSHGWTWLTAVCFILFSLMHWPCSTSCLTVRKETKSWKWTLISFAVPTVMGFAVCFLVAATARLCGLAPW